MTRSLSFSRSFILSALTLCALTSCRTQTQRDFSGTLEMTEHALGARVAGRLVTLTVDEGSVVTRGQRLATFDRFEKAQRDYQRVQDNFKSGGSTRQALEDAELQLQDQQVISPVDGVVLTRVRSVGEYVAAGGPVVVVGDRAAYWVRIFVPEGQINTLQMDQVATLHLDGVSEAYKGKITYIAPRAEFTPRNVQTPEERVTQTFAVKVSIDNPPASLRPGVAVDVRFE